MCREYQCKGGRGIHLFIRFGILAWFVLPFSSIFIMYMFTVGYSASMKHQCLGGLWVCSPRRHYEVASEAFLTSFAEYKIA